jgi:DNA-binding MarR family transcriptional regulator
VYVDSEQNGYLLDEQVGFLLRKANQRHRGIFSQAVDQRIAPSQFAALAKLAERGPTSQNLLGRLTAMDAATIRGVVERLRAQGLVTRTRDPADARRRLVELTEAGTAFLAELLPVAKEITTATLAPLEPGEAETLLELLRRISAEDE